MFRLNKQEYTGVLPFSRSLATKCMSLNNEPCLARATLIDINPIKRNCYDS